MTNENEESDMLDDSAPARRGRPPGRRNAVRESPRNGPRVYQGRDGEELTRTRKSGLDPFDVPKHFPPQGWEYQWVAVASVGNKEIVRTMNHEMWQNGWRPVPAKRHDGYFLPKGEEGSIIVRDQMLMERPTDMCEEARNEDKRNAIQQMRDRDQSLMGGKANLAGLGQQGIPVMGTGDRRGTAVRMAIDPALDIPMPSHKLAEPGE
jgi:hypothetical protein